MPTYCYKNRNTGEVVEKTMTVAEMCQFEENGGMIIDGVQYERDIASEHGGHKKISGWPLKSDAAGVHPKDAVKAMKGADKMGVPTDFDKNTGQAVFTDRSHRKAYMKAMGLHDRNGGYGD